MKRLVSIALLLLSCPFVFASDLSPESSAPQKQLSNGLVQLTVLLPDAEKGYYRGTRFDWSGLILRATYKRHTFFEPWKTTHDPKNHDDVAGPAEEYGMQVPIGFQEARPGGTFLKIGVGELEKNDQPEFQFWHTYKIVRPGTWQIKSGADWMEFQQEVRSKDGWGYHYTKRIELRKDQPAFVIEHRLKNTGSRAFASNHYCHNFIMIDGRPIDAQYQLGLPFAARAKSEADLKGAAKVVGNKVKFLRRLAHGEGVLMQLDGLTGTANDNQVTVSNLASHASMHIKGDRALSKYNIYVAELAVCPEPFIELKLEPGQEEAWSNEYTLEVRPQ
jgi:hypothetical protein